MLWMSWWHLGCSWEVCTQEVKAKRALWDMGFLNKVLVFFKVMGLVDKDSSMDANTGIHQGTSLSIV